jgi:hypothetical protein
VRPPQFRTPIRLASIGDSLFMDNDFGAFDLTKVVPFLNGRGVMGKRPGFTVSFSAKSGARLLAYRGINGQTTIELLARHGNAAGNAGCSMAMQSAAARRWQCFASASTTFCSM